MSSRLEEDAPPAAAGRDDLALVGAGAGRADAVDELAPAWPMVFGDAVFEGAVQDLVEILASEQAQAGVVAGEQHPVPPDAQEAGRLLFEQVNEIGRVERVRRGSCHSSPMGSRFRRERPQQ
jgi:hypothetical protein